MRAFNSSHLQSAGFRHQAFASASATALLLSLSAGQSAYAQGAPQAAQANPAPVEEIVVTGTRVQRDGYEAPTPLTVMTEAELNEAPRGNIAEFVNDLPSVVGSDTPTPPISSSAGTNGVNALNLRGLGSNRTLVLFDGQRNVASELTGQVDVNDIPQSLVSRVDVVTGGASAQYGSDALSGVVNFILDRKFVGLKGEVSGGVTTYGDDRQWKVSLTGGTEFAGGRGHLLLSGEMASRDGISGVPRAWNQHGCYRINNPAYTATNGQPEQFITCNAALDAATAGGIITAGPLKGVAFGPGGTPFMFNYGATKDPWMIGGDWASNQFNSRISLDTFEARQSAFARAAYDITDNINVFVQLSWNNTSSRAVGGSQFNQGNVVLKSDNAYLPATVAAQLAALKLTSITMGTMNPDLTSRPTYDARIVNRYVVGADGAFDAFDTGWKWSAYYQKGVSRTNENLLDVSNNARIALAQDAVRGPNGQIVCRSTLTNPNDGCVPLDRVGLGVVTQAARNYVLGNEHRNQDFRQDVMAVSMTGEPFSDWAGPVSLATGVEHRRENVSGFVPPEYQSGWFNGNFLPTFGTYTVTEGFVETVVPLAKETVWAKSLDLNAAARFTGYSTSGFVTTWKAGLTYNPIDDIRFRVTRSRDIRAPNLAELFAAGTSNTNNVIDPFNNNASTQYTGFATGNLNLQPEKADTTGLGVVLQPSFFPGFNASVDYYNIKIGNAIGQLSAQRIVDLCFQGGQVYCNAITRGFVAGAPVISRIAIQPFNFVTQTNRGIDFETSYRTRLSSIVDSWPDGNFTIRLLATRFLKNYSNDGTTSTQTAGSNAGNGPPRWRWNGSMNYSGEVIGFTFTARGVSAGVYDTSNIQCTSGCPVTSTIAHTINDNHIDGAVYFDSTVTYKFKVGEGTNFEAFLNVKNLFNTDPVLVGQGPGGSAYGLPAANGSLYDVLGRVFRAGIRFKM